MGLDLTHLRDRYQLESAPSSLPRSTTLTTKYRIISVYFRLHVSKLLRMRVNILLNQFMRLSVVGAPCGEPFETIRVEKLPHL